ncbi:hypothetical protein [Amycolatopsis methanolica]|uniref:Uncharacterized protein n=1 Tax=Amycolatopsis methanolica 239 TaxID=1068978 RepID=A0A076N0B9_AMYME|nr:hypothetical protein [Amycolatopsis methanolica]AIJ26278.1 hypothetical protein AMETH_6186 [Amycolatopsis methanolica 239]
MTEGNGGRQAQAEIQSAISSTRGPAQIDSMVGAGLSFVGGAGYSFDPDQIAALIPKWKELIEGLDDDFQKLQLAWGAVTAPSPDQPAVRNAAITQSSIEAAMTHNRQLVSYAGKWLDALKKANGTYVEQEQHTGAGLYVDDDQDTSGHGLYS